MSDQVQAQVEIYHAGWGRRAKVPANIWPGRLAAKGWELVGADTDTDADPETETDTVTAVDKAALQARADELGIDYDRRWGSTRLAEAIEAAIT